MVSSTAVIYSSSSAGYPGASLHRSCGGFLREGSTKERRGFSLFPLHCSLGFASRFLLPSGATRKRARRGRVWCRTLALAILWLRQEPISRRKQLPCTRVKAFSPTRLFLRAILARIWNILLVPQTSQQIPLTWKWYPSAYLILWMSSISREKLLTVSCVKLTSELRHTVCISYLFW